MRGMSGLRHDVERHRESCGAGNLPHRVWPMTLRTGGAQQNAPGVPGAFAAIASRHCKSRPRWPTVIVGIRAADSIAGRGPSGARVGHRIQMSGCVGP